MVKIQIIAGINPTCFLELIKWLRLIINKVSIIFYKNILCWLWNFKSKYVPDELISLKRRDEVLRKKWKTREDQKIGV